VPVIDLNYNGYLKPHVEKIQRLVSEGKSAPEIGRILYADGLRSPYDTGPDANGHRLDHARSFASMIYVLLGLRPNNRRKKLQQHIAHKQQQLRELREQERREQRRLIRLNQNSDANVAA
jgi:hypothetical protein